MLVLLTLEQVVSETCFVKIDGVSFTLYLKEECNVANGSASKVQKVVDLEWDNSVSEVNSMEGSGEDEIRFENVEEDVVSLVKESIALVGKRQQ